MSQTQLRQCDFCDEFIAPDEPLGTAHTYLRYPDDREDGVEHVRVCSTCALSRTDASGYDDDHDVAACDICGRVGYTGGGNKDGELWRLSYVQGWSVSIRGLKGGLKVCREHSPIRGIDMFPRADRNPDDWNERYGPEGTAGGDVDVATIERV